MAAGTIAENNLILNTNHGIAVRLEGASSWKNTRVIHNTVYGATDTAFSINGLNTGIADTLIISNNVFSVGGSGTAYGYHWYPEDAVGGTVKNNYFDGLDYGSSLTISQMRRINGTVFVEPSISLPADFTPVGDLRDGGDSANSLTDDFDNNARPSGSAPDVGCYEAGSGPHWDIQKSFKDSSGSVGDGSDGNGGDGAAGCLIAPSYLNLIAPLSA